MKNIWIIIVTVILTGLIVGGGTYYFVNSEAEKDKKELNKQITNLQKQISESSNDETDNWQIYVSEEYGYSIKFPKNLYYKGDKVQQYPGEFGAMDLIISDIEKMGIQDVMLDEKIHITVTINKKSADETLYDYLKQQGIPDNQLSEITFNNVKSYKMQSSFDQPSISIYTVNNNIVYGLQGINYLKESINSDNFLLIQKIIDTFKFI